MSITHTIKWLDNVWTYPFHTPTLGHTRTKVTQDLGYITQFLHNISEVPLDGQTLLESQQEVSTGAVKVWQRALQSCLECSPPCHTDIQCQSSTIAASLHLWSTCLLMAKHCLKVGWKSKSKAWNLPTWGCKGMMEASKKMLWAFITLLYIHTMANKHYSSTYMMTYHLISNHWLKLAGNRDFCQIRKETCQHVDVKIWLMPL